MDHDQRHRREQYWANTGGHPYQHGAHGAHPQEQEYKGHERPPHMNHQPPQHVRHEPSPHMNHQPPPHMSRQLQMEDAIVIARERVPGQVVQAELERRRGQLVYEIDIITNQGVKYEVIVDAESGRILSIELD